MLQPIHTPLPAADRIAGLLLHLEQAQAPSLTLTTLAVRRGGEVPAYVVAHLEDGSRHHFDAGDARVMARCLRDDQAPWSDPGQMQAWADSLEAAADAAERQASAILLGMGQGGGVVPLRQFGGRT
jgi:hypothetical protein